MGNEILSVNHTNQKLLVNVIVFTSITGYHLKSFPNQSHEFNDKPKEGDEFVR